MSKSSQYVDVWDLDSIMPHPSNEEFGHILADYRADLTGLADDSDALQPVTAEPAHVAGWVEFLKKFEAIDRRARDLRSFVECHASAEARNRELQRLEGVLASLEPLRERIATSVEFAMKAASDPEFSQFIAAHGWLRENSFFLEECRQDAAFRLPEEQELLSAELAVDGIHGWGRLYDRVSGALSIRVMERGEIVEKSPGQIHFDSPQRAVRENNFYAADKAWSGIADICADALNHISGTRLTIYRRLGLEDHLEAPLRRNRMKRETLTAMWDTISRRKRPLVDYLHRKAKLLGLERLAWYDVQAPLGAGDRTSADSELPYDDACRKIIHAFDGFSSDFGDFARRAIEGRWIEAENRSGKRQGGFCTDFPSRRESRIFMTFTNSPDSLSTLAHELGHAYHTGVLCDRPFFLQQYPMNLAETASTFAEAVVLEQRLRESSSTAEQLQILDGMLSDAVAFLMNIHARFLFEDRFHSERSGGEVGVDRLGQLMLEAQREAYCDCLDADGWNPNFWISKLHFYISTLPFYNFPYTFGYLLSLGLRGLAAENRDDFAEVYRRFLLQTGSQQTEPAVGSTLNVDLTDSTFWEKCMDVVDGRVAQFLELSE